MGTYEKPLNHEHIEHLEELDKRQLMAYLDYTRKFKGVYSPCGVHYYTAEEIKHVLKDRPHVPNKQERRAQRQAEAKRRKNR